MPERDLLARNVREGMQVKDLDTGEWLTVQAVLNIAKPLKVLHMSFADGTSAAMDPSGRVRCRNAEDGSDA
jgi:hypothetical protein